MSASLQRLGDDPRDHDGLFTSLPPVNSNSRPFSPHTSPEVTTTGNSKLEPWKIYPPPPSPHWKFKAPNARAPEASHPHEDGDVPFEFSKCEIPTAGPWEWEMDERGVFQVYENATGMLSLIRTGVITEKCRVSSRSQAAL
jgi:AMP deaminase